jgi:putative two-component system response regulator
MFRRTVLVVDDTPDNIRVLINILRDDYDIRVATNGVDAIENSLIEPIPDLILLDVMMPEMDGLEVCRRVKANPITENIPVIFVTAKDRVEDETAGFEAGGVDYITKPVSAPIVKARVKTHLQLKRTEELDKLANSAIHMLAEAGHYNDTDTGVHVWRMGAYSQALARAVGWEERDVVTIGLAAPMHDTGKIGISDDILKAPRKLTPEEWEIMKTHSEIGYKILVQSDTPVFKMASQIALRHHEKWDGTGYPDGLAGEDIPESARIVAIADIFDALTMKRPYKNAWSVEDAIAELQKMAGSHLEKRLVDKFLEIQETILEIKSKWDRKEESGEY